jgi:hypothetical protein
VGEDRPQTSRQRVSVAQAAEILGVTVEAIRGRIKRGTLEHERHSGTVYVLLDADQPTNQPRPDTDQTANRLQPESSALISEMRERLAFLERELDVRTEEIRRRDTIIMNMTEAMKALNPPAPENSSEARESPESSAPTGESGELRDELSTERTRREMAESTLHEGMAEEQRRREEAERGRDELRQELYALREPRESPETVEEQQGRGQPHSDAPGAPEAVRRPWRTLWRRIWGR